MDGLGKQGPDRTHGSGMWHIEHDLARTGRLGQGCEQPHPHMRVHGGTVSRALPGVW